MSNVIKSRKAAVIGCGFVGSATAFTLMQSKLFSELVLLDVNREKADGEAMDISHGVPFAAPMKIYAGDYDDVADAAIIIVTAGANQKPDETRLDLVHRNVEIYKSIIPEIASRNFGGILLIVSNPVDILTYVALRLSGLPENRVIGSGTVLDTARMKYALGEHLRVDSRSVHSYIVGEHGDSEIAVLSSTNISGIPLPFGPSYRINTASPFCTLCFNTASRHSSSLSKGLARRTTLNISFGQAVCLITAPSGARFPLSTAMLPSVPMALS